MKKKILIFGAGAIGRGFVAPLFFKNNYEISFVDSNMSLINKLNKKKKYYAGLIKKNKYDLSQILINKTYHVSEKIDVRSFDLVISCVGINNCYKNYELYKNARYLISCENDIETVTKLKKITKNKNVFFGIPDVITSNTAPKKILRKDDLTVISEDGVLVLEKFVKQLPKEIEFVTKKDLKKHWICKLYIHNAPHAIAAYLGYLKKLKFIHESMQNEKIKKIVEGSIKEITDGLVNFKVIDKKFAYHYMKKELKRFSNKLLFDPISRVARDPIRKLSKNDRLIKSIQIALYSKRLPSNCAIGILAALKYYDKNDEQSQQIKYLMENFGEKYVFKKICGLDENDPLIDFCLKQNIKI
jgi:mannitol-1-phosphate/altronate dehydrogenase